MFRRVANYLLLFITISRQINEMVINTSSHYVFSILVFDYNYSV